MRNERGITLVESLAALTILSIIGVIIWNVFFQGYNFSKNAASKNMMQQEANIIIAHLNRIHQTAVSYKISIPENGTIEITVNERNHSTRKVLFKNSQLLFQINKIGKIDPKNDDIDLIITIKDKNNPDNFVEVETLLYRLKGGGS
ncbi:PilW family protein [Bacillus marasmi]|uniref:PilW family protein n=1 Tax=Bacillus marasmi TaxID=1926279 RepID=UPI0011CC8E1F|nr:type II secretion system protein [Bacillus marasmi]